jgi:hypothetical protein
VTIFLYQIEFVTLASLLQLNLVSQSSTHCTVQTHNKVGCCI